MLALLLACPPAEEPDAPVAEDKCPHVAMDQLAGRWIKVQGNQGDHTHRVQVNQHGSAYEGWFVNGSFAKLSMAGVLRETDLQLTQVLSAEDEAAWKAGNKDRVRLYLEPYKQRCALRVVEARLKWAEGGETEVQVGSGYQEYLQFPEGTELTFRPCDEPLFIGDAAANEAASAKQIEAGMPVASFGEAVPSALWTEAAADGDPACSYSFDAYFDDQPVADARGLPAGAVADGKRTWSYAWNAPYSGNHILEMYRYRQCGEGERELLAVACADGVLQ